MLLVPAQ